MRPGCPLPLRPLRCPSPHTFRTTRRGELCSLPPQSSRRESHWFERPFPAPLRASPVRPLGRDSDATLAKQPSIPSPAECSACPPGLPLHLVPVSVTVLTMLLGGRGAQLSHQSPHYGGRPKGLHLPTWLRSPLPRLEPGAQWVLHTCLLHEWTRSKTRSVSWKHFFFFWSRGYIRSLHGRFCCLGIPCRLLRKVRSTYP